MKSTLLKAIFLTSLAFHWTPLRAEAPTSVPYGPAVVSLTGTIVRAYYDDEYVPSPGGRVLILRLDRPISVPAQTGDEVNTEEKNVREVQLNPVHFDLRQHPIAKHEFGRIRFTATGELYHGISAGHLRAIVMSVSDLQRAPAKAKRD